MAENTKTKKKDFVELEFIGKDLLNNEVFDTNIKEEAKKINFEVKDKLLIVCIGENMVVKGFDEALEGKEIGKKYIVKLEPEKAFGKRNPQMIRLIPKKMFIEQRIDPQPGMTLALDDALVRVISVSGGRVMVDFNNPLAGKEIEYEFVIKKAVEDTREKINAFQNFFFGKEFEFELNEKDKKIIFSELQLTPVLGMFKDKFKDILGYDVEILAKKDNKIEIKKSP